MYQGKRKDEGGRMKDEKGRMMAGVWRRKAEE
jgi:hypothetical protein